MTGAISIHEHDIIDLMATYPEGIRLSQLMEVVDERYGKSVSFHTGSSTGMNLDGMFRFPEGSIEPTDSIHIRQSLAASPER